MPISSDNFQYGLLRVGDEESEQKTVKAVVDCILLDQVYNEVKLYSDLINCASDIIQ